MIYHCKFTIIIIIMVIITALLFGYGSMCHTAAASHNNAARARYVEGMGQIGPKQFENKLRTPEQRLRQQCPHSRAHITTHTHQTDDEG